MHAPSRTILVSGAASGLGHAFALHYALTEPRSRVIAIDINPEPSSSLRPSGEHNLTNLSYHPCDVTDPSAVARILARTLGEHSNPAAHSPLHLVVHSAGIRGLVPSIEKQDPHDVAAAETWRVMDKDTLMRTFEVNSAGTFFLIRACLPYLLSGGAQGANPKVAVMGSRMGSMSYNSAGGGYAYRASKAALNALVKSFAIDVPEVVFAVVHPGRVETRLVKVKEEGAIAPEESLRDMVPLIERLGLQESGRYVDRLGKDIRW